MNVCTLLGRPVAYIIKVALSNVNWMFMYIKGRKNRCANDAMNGRVNEVMMRDVRGKHCGFLCLVEERSRVAPKRTRSLVSSVISG